MKRFVAISAFLLLAATSLFAHAGHEHTYMGTVTVINNNTEFVLTTAEEQELTVQTTAETKWRRADGHAAAQSELVVGARVVVKMGKDGKSAAEIKIGSSPAAH
ncbi:MAG: hypothetical protein ABI718_14645 [Acidobacteriota bacterium]